MSCVSNQRKIALHASGDLSDRTARKLERHLDTCAACRTYADALATTLTTVCSAARPSHGDTREMAAFRADVRAKLHEERLRELRGGFAWQRVLAWSATAIVLLAVTGAGGLRLAQGGATAPALEPVVATLPHTAPTEVSAAPALMREERMPPKIIILTDNPNLVVYWLGSEENGNASPTV
jgi:anti-sigma factor RsiW